MDKEVLREFWGIPSLQIRWGGVSRDTVTRAIKRGDLKVIYFAGRVMVPRSEVERVERFGLGNGRKRRSNAKKAAK